MKFHFPSFFLASCFVFNATLANPIVETNPEKSDESSSYWKPIIYIVTTAASLVAAHRLWKWRTLNTIPTSPRHLEGKKILVAEDDRMQAAIVERRLKRLGAKEVVVKGNAEDTVEAARTHHFDIVLLDNNMPLHPDGSPKLDAGLSAATRIRRNSDGTTPVLMHSSSSISLEQLQAHDVQGEVVKGQTGDEGYEAAVEKATTPRRHTF